MNPLIQPVCPKKLNCNHRKHKMICLDMKETSTHQDMNLRERVVFQESNFIVNKYRREKKLFRKFLVGDI